MLSIKTGIAPSVWAAEEPVMILTALDVLEEIADRERQANRG